MPDGRDLHRMFLRIFSDSSSEEPGEVQNQTILPMKAGTRKQLDAGLRVARISAEQGLRGTQVRQCLVASSACMAVKQAREAQRAGNPLRRFALHEYCCSEDSLLGKAALAKGMKVRRWGLFNTDLYKAKGVQLVADTIKKDIHAGLTAVLWVSLPCDPWCAYQRLNVFKSRSFAEKLEKRRRASLRALELLRQLLRKFEAELKSHRLRVSFEWPRNNDGWKTRAMQRLRKALPITCNFEGCQYGLRHQKPWRVATNFLPLFTRLTVRRCPRGHRHEKPDSKELRRSELYTPTMVADIIAGMTAKGIVSSSGSKAKNQKPSPKHGSSCPNHSGSRCSTHSGSKGEVLMTLPVERKKIGADTKDAEEKETERTTRLAVAKLHVNLGHPSNKALARAIRLTGGSDLAISIALAHKCPVCERLKTPTNPSHQAAGLAEVQDFGQAIAIDLFALADCFGLAASFLNIVDLGSGYQVVRPVRSKHPQVIWDALLEGWLSWAGAPTSIIFDGGGEFRKEVSEELEHMEVK